MLYVINLTGNDSTFLKGPVSGRLVEFVCGVQISLRAKLPIALCRTIVGGESAGTRAGRQKSFSIFSTLPNESFVVLSKFGNKACLDMWELRGWSWGNDTCICLSLKRSQNKPFYYMAQVTSGKVTRCGWLLTWQDFSWPRGLWKLSMLCEQKQTQNPKEK